LSYQILPNIIFIFSILGIVLIILRRLPEAGAEAGNQAEEAEAHEILQDKGLPAQAISKIKVAVTFAVKKSWNFILEAKDLKPHAAAGYKMKKLFAALPGFKKQDIHPVLSADVKNEQYYLDQIKQEPKNLTLYDALGKFYLEAENFGDAKDIYQYLVNHQPASPDFQARLAYCFFQTKNYERAAEHYQKSLALDSTQPNRYYNLGLSLESAGKTAESVEHFEHAAGLEPAPKFYVSLSAAYEKLGNTDKAREALQLAQKLDPDNESVKEKLEKLVKI